MDYYYCLSQFMGLTVCKDDLSEFACEKCMPQIVIEHSAEHCNSVRQITKS